MPFANNYPYTFFVKSIFPSPSCWTTLQLSQALISQPTDYYYSYIKKVKVNRLWIESDCLGSSLGPTMY